MAPALSPAFALLARLGVLPALAEQPSSRSTPARRLGVVDRPGISIERWALPGRGVLFEFGDAMDAVHVVLQGTLKTVTHDESGVERITSFVRRGEVVGFEHTSDGRHAAEAVTLEPSVVLALPVAGLEAMAMDDPTLLRLWWRSCAEPMERHAAQLVLLARRLVHERLEQFLWSLVETRELGADSSPRLHLAMGRGEIANYLGMTNESVSRAFAKLVADGRIRVRGRHVDLLSVPASPSGLASRRA